MAHDPTDGELAEYIVRRLGHIGDYAREPDLVAELIAYDRDLWVRLFRIDHDDLGTLEPGELRSADPS